MWHRKPDYVDLWNGESRDKHHSEKGMAMHSRSDDAPPEHDPTDAERAALLVRESWWFLLALLVFLLLLHTV